MTASQAVVERTMSETRAADQATQALARAAEAPARWKGRLRGGSPGFRFRSTQATIL